MSPLQLLSCSCAVRCLSHLLLFLSEDDLIFLLIWILCLDVHFVVVVIHPAWGPLRHLFYGWVPVISLEKFSAFLSSNMLSSSLQLHILQLLKLSLVLRYFDFFSSFLSFYFSLESFYWYTFQLTVDLILSSLIMMP